VYPKEYRCRQQVQGSRAYERRRTFGHQNDLKKGRLYAGLVAIVEVARQVAQEVHVKNMVTLAAGIQPAVEDEIFGA
jgi:hypothetical protein